MEVGALGASGCGSSLDSTPQFVISLILAGFHFAGKIIEPDIFQLLSGVLVRLFSVLLSH